MDGGIRQAGRNAGGIAALAGIVERHGDALEYDLMTGTGRTLSEYEAMGAAGTVALCSYIKHLQPTSATWRAVHPEDELPAWTERRQTNTMLADIYDAVAKLIAVTAVHGTGKRAKRTDPYPRPNSKKRRHIGAKPIAASKFAAWWDSKKKGA